MRRKKHEPPPKEGLDEPLGPPPEAYLYRCAVCSTERLVHEAIIDAGIGMAKFRQEYSQGFMPTIGGPGCNGETMEYVAQEA
jgi:hypothetical protein